MSYTAVPHGSYSPPDGVYTNQLMSYSLKKDIELTPVGPPHAHSDQSHSTHLPEHKLSAVQLAHKHEFKQNTTHGRARKILRNIWLTAFLPCIAFAYISFCYAAATRVVPVRVYMVDEPENHLSAIKAGVTTINIIIIALALLPLKSLIDDLKAEFFRMLQNTKNGVPIKAVNNVSTPSHSYIRGCLAVAQNHASRYYVGAIVSAIAAALISSLAPAALSVGVLVVDDDITAFRVGAVASDSVIVSTVFQVQNNRRFTARASEAASMGWVQSVLGVEMPFEATSPRYAVPVPLDLDVTSRARYITDVVVMDPVCNWTVPDPPLVPPTNASSFTATVNVSLPTFGVGSDLPVTTFQFSSNIKSLKVFSEDSTRELFNLTTKDPPIQGTMGWIMMHCTSCDPKKSFALDESVIDFSGIPYQEYTGPAFLGNGTQTARFSILLCNPRASIETREVRLDGSGKIQVMESSGLPRQGNLNTAQTRLLAGRALRSYPEESGPDSGFDGIGQSGQVQLFFGNVDNSTTTPVLKPRSIEDITQGYIVTQQAAMRSYLSGRMASAYVPGRAQKMKLVFTSSLPQVIVSTVLFAFVALFINICHLRSETDQFTLFSVSAALARSNICGVCEDVRYVDHRRGALQEDIALQTLENKRIRLANTGGPGHSLHME